MEKNYQKNIQEKADEWYINKSDKLSKIKEIRKNENKIKKENYIYEFTRSEASVIMKGRGRMLPLKNSFKIVLWEMFFVPDAKKKRIVKNLSLVNPNYRVTFK